MTTFEILLITFLAMILISIILVSVTILFKIKIDRRKAAILSHRELWLYYMNEPELVGILSNNNGTGECPIKADNMSEKQYRFLVLFLNHMESMLPSWKKYEKDWVGLFRNPCLRKVYENTKLYRNKKFCKLIDGIINGYQD